MANTRTEPRIIPLTHEERALVYSVNHDEHLLLVRVFAYLHWANARAHALDAPCQVALPIAPALDAGIADDAQAVVDDVILRGLDALGEDDEEDGRVAC